MPGTVYVKCKLYSVQVRVLRLYAYCAKCVVKWSVCSIVRTIRYTRCTCCKTFERASTHYWLKYYPLRTHPIYIYIYPNCDNETGELCVRKLYSSAQHSIFIYLIDTRLYICDQVRRSWRKIDIVCSAALSLRWQSARAQLPLINCHWNFDNALAICKSM